MVESTRTDALSGVRSAYESQPKGRGEGSSPRFPLAAVGSTPYTGPRNTRLGRLSPHALRHFTEHPSRDTAQSRAHTCTRRGLSGVPGQWPGIRQPGSAFPRDRGGTGAEQKRLRAGCGSSQRRCSGGGAGRVLAYLPPDLGQGCQPGHARGGPGSPGSWAGPFVARPGGLPAGCGRDGLHCRCRAERSRTAGPAPLGRLHRDELPRLVVAGGGPGGSHGSGHGRSRSGAGNPHGADGGGVARPLGGPLARRLVPTRP